MDTKTLEKGKEIASKIERYEKLIQRSKKNARILFNWDGDNFILSLPEVVEKELLAKVVNAWVEEKKFLEDEFKNL